MIVIADDITGAAEIAGIAFSQGQQVSLLCGCPTCGCGTATNETVVIATDTRSISEAEAVATIKRMILPHYMEGDGGRLLFKKTDSALRGHVVAELSALMEATGYRRAVYLPANPSKGRVIRNGIYYIKEVRGDRLEVRDVPISETAFSYDPEFPAKTSVLKERFPDAESKGIIMPDAESEADIRRIIAEYDDGHTLFAGAADLFTALLSSHNIPLTSCPLPLTSKITLILCGSTQSKPLDLGIPICPMPKEIYDGSDDLTIWDASAYSEAHGLILTMPYTHRTGKEVAVHLRTMMAEMAKRLITTYYLPLYLEGGGGRLSLIIEGGATAWATLQALGWTDFTITAQFAPGVVQMKSVTTGTLVTLKPGSYPWGNLFSAG